MWDFFVDYRGFHAFANRQAVRRRGTTAMSCEWSRLEQEDFERQWTQQHDALICYYGLSHRTGTLAI